MPSAADHIRRASHNQDILRYLLERDPVPFDWITTVGFYKSVHLIEALFAKDSSKHSTNHGDRYQELQKKRYSHIFKYYSPLYRAGRVARYLPDGGFAKCKSPEQIIGDLLNNNLQQIEKSVLKLQTSFKNLGLKEFYRIEYKNLPLVKNSTPAAST